MTDLIALVGLSVVVWQLRRIHRQLEIGNKNFWLINKVGISQGYANEKMQEGFDKLSKLKTPPAGIYK